MIELRQATHKDITSITSIFRDTIVHVNSKDYSEKQVKVWASGADNTETWKQRVKDLYFIVAEINTTIVGFAYLKEGYYLDGLFVHKDYQGQGIASKLLRIIESRVISGGFKSIHSDVSITALPFFENHEYVVERKQKKSFKGLIFENYIVSKQL